MKKIALIVVALTTSMQLSFSQTGTYTDLYTGSFTKDGGPTTYSGWGNAPNTTIDSRPASQVPYIINNHTGLTFSAHSAYGGIRFYNQGYPGLWNSSQGSTMVMSITDGKVGIGTATPGAPVHITKSSTLNADVPLQRWDSGLSAYNLTLTNYNSSWGIDYHFNQLHNNTSIPVLAFQAGRVGIGTINPDAAFKLSVLGAIRATEIKVETGWADYVFDEAYKLRPIAEVEAYIKQNHHLPDVPTAAEVEKNGVNLGETSSLLLKKIEELTLYLIEKDKQVINQNKQLEQQRALNKQQATKLADLEERLSKLTDKIDKHLRN